MADLVVHPSTKMIQLSYVLWIAVAIGIVAVRQFYAVNNIEYAFAVPILGIVWSAAKHIKRLYTTLSIVGSKLSFEEGILSRSARNMDIAKIQDVRVDQTLGQRMMNLGNLTLETAGETGSLTMPNIDRPRNVAEAILGAASRPTPPSI